MARAICKISIQKIQNHITYSCFFIGLIITVLIHRVGFFKEMGQISCSKGLILIIKTSFLFSRRNSTVNNNEYFVTNRARCGGEATER